MLRKSVVLSLVMFFVLLLSSQCFASEKPFADITTTQQIIDKLFAGRTLDPIEGIWFRDELQEVAIVKSSVLYPNQATQLYDYFVIIIEKGRISGAVWRNLNKTKYSFAFIDSETYTGKHFYWKLLSPTVLELGVHMAYPVNNTETYVRTYPTPQQ